MHELAIMKNVISIVESEAQKGEFTRVIAIKLRIGAASGIVHRCMSDFFPIASRGTIAENAELRMEAIAVTVHCNSCGFEGAPSGAVCQSCGGEDYTLVTGREFLVDSIEVE